MTWKNFSAIRTIPAQPIHPKNVNPINAKTNLNGRSTINYGPLILIPLWAYHERNAWLLIGISISYLGSFSAAFNSKLIFLFLMLCIGVWLKAGFSFHQYITFFFFCAAFGYLFFELAESTQN